MKNLVINGESIDSISSPKKIINLKQAFFKQSSDDKSRTSQ